MSTLFLLRVDYRLLLFVVSPRTPEGTGKSEGDDEGDDRCGRSPSLTVHVKGAVE